MSLAKGFLIIFLCLYLLNLCSRPFSPQTLVLGVRRNMAFCFHIVFILFSSSFFILSSVIYQCPLVFILTTQSDIHQVLLSLLSSLSQIKKSTSLHLNITTLMQIQSSLYPLHFFFSVMVPELVTPISFLPPIQFFFFNLLAK